jgi:hypothetical protein
MKGDRAACVPRVPWTPLRGAVPQKNRGKPLRLPNLAATPLFFADLKGRNRQRRQPQSIRQAWGGCGRMRERASSSPSDRTERSCVMHPAILITSPCIDPADLVALEWLSRLRVLGTLAILTGGVPEGIEVHRDRHVAVIDRAARLAAIPAGESPANRRRSSHCCSYNQQRGGRPSR